MDETEEISYASLKRKNDIDHSETIVYASPQKGKVKMKSMKKYTRNQSLKLLLRLKNNL